MDIRSNSPQLKRFGQFALRRVLFRAVSVIDMMWQSGLSVVRPFLVMGAKSVMEAFLVIGGILVCEGFRSLGYFE